jgi:hypothetical protein
MDSEGEAVLRMQNLVAKQMLTTEEDAQPNRRGTEMGFLYAVGSHEDTADAMEAFGIEESELPCAVVHYTQSDTKFKMGEQDLPLTTASLAGFYKAVAGGTRAPLPRGGDDEGGDEL